MSGSRHQEPCFVCGTMVCGEEDEPGREASPEQEGRVAYQAGVPQHQNPYAATFAQSEARLAWLTGWLAAEGREATPDEHARAREWWKHLPTDERVALWQASEGRDTKPVGEWCVQHKVYDCDERGPCASGRKATVPEGTDVSGSRQQESDWDAAAGDWDMHALDSGYEEFPHDE